MVVVETIRDVAITVALAVLIPLTLVFGFEAFWPRPVWTGSEELTKAEKEYRELNTRVNELREEKKFEEANTLKKQVDEAETNVQTLRKPIDDEFNEAMKKYDRFYLTVATVVGAVLVVTSFFIYITFLSAGLLFGGVASVVIGVMSNWHRMHTQLQFFILLGAIIALLILSYLFFMRSRKQHS